MIKLLEKIGGIARLIFETLSYIIRGKVSLKSTANQMVALGVQSIPLVLIICGFTGMVFSLQVAQELEKFGAASLIGQLLAIAIVRELGPVLTGVVLAGRAGSAIAAELGTMKITEQVDALRALATNPVQYLVAPRFLACIIMVPVLTVFGNLIGMYGGYLVAVNQVGVIPQVFYESAINFISIYDLFCSLLKGAIYGMIVVVSGCIHGLGTEKGAQGVGDSTIASVVSGMVLIFIANYLLSAIMW